MKIKAIRDSDGEPAISLSDVFSGIGIETDMGLFGIAQRDDGIEVMLDGKTVWTSHEIVSDPELVLGSPALREAQPRQQHWFYADGPNNPPKLQPDYPTDREFADHIRAAARFAVRASTACGVVDPDAIVKNMVIGALSLPVPNADGTFSNPKPTFSEPVKLPDGSGAFVASWPLPKDHWLYAEYDNKPPMPMRVGVGPRRSELAIDIKQAARYAIRASTMNGKEVEFDPDAMVQNMVIGLLGYWTEDGRRGE